MIITIKAGEHNPVMTWALFVWKYLVSIMRGCFSIGMDLWNFKDSNIAHQLFARKSFFSADGAALLIKHDHHHVGRFTVYAFVRDGHTFVTEELGYFYNDRIYNVSIKKKSHSWKIMFDGKFAEIKVSRTPLITHNDLPKINSKVTTEEDIIINFTQDE